MKSGLSVKIDNLAKIAAGVELLAVSRVMVGIPADKTQRRSEPGSEPITNAEIGYLMEHGIPEKNVPAREHMLPGLRSVKKELDAGLRKAGELALEGRPMAVEQQLNRVGMRGASAVKAKINDGVPPPLAESTLKRRAARGRKGAKQELKNRAAGQAPSVELAKPLVNTAQYRNAITYVVRRDSSKKPR